MVLTRLYICSVLCFVVVNCYGHKKLFRRQSLNYEVIGNYESGTQKFYSNLLVIKHNEESCSNRSFNAALKSNMNYFKCAPREAIVHLYSENVNVEMVPNQVVVKRCYETGCYGKNSCLPSKIVERKVPVRLHYRVQKQKKCSWVTVEEHTECKCGCQVTAKHCADKNKVFFPKECTCKCKNEDERRNCINKENMEWDEENCTCTCPQGGMLCTTGTTWVPEYCKCMQVMLRQDSLLIA